MSGAGGTAARRETWFAAGVALTFAAVAGFSTFHHEMWRDELQAWLFARDSATPLDVLANTRYEGHPPLWFLALWPLARLGLPAAAMQILNVLVGAGTAWIVARYAPAPRWVRAVAALGYLAVYEYGTIARNYGVGVLAVVACCALFPGRRERPLRLGALLALAALTSLPACVLALAALIALAAEAAVSPPAAERRAPVWAGLAVAAAGVVVSAAQMSPPPDGGTVTGWTLELHLGGVAQVLATVPRAYLPLPEWRASFWQSDLLGRVPGYLAVSWLAGGAFVLVVCAGLLRRPIALLFYGAATAGTLTFFYVKTLGYLRHWGFLFVALGAALWMARSLPPTRLPGRLAAVGERGERILGALFALLVMVHLAAAAVAVAGERRWVFSGASGMAALVRASGLERLPIVADRDIRTVGVVGHLDVDRVLYAHGGRYGSYITWDTARHRRLNVWTLAAQRAVAERSPVLVLLDSDAMAKVSMPRELATFVREVGCAPGEIVPDESFCGALVDPMAPAR